jgi:hypothetical protein
MPSRKPQTLTGLSNQALVQIDVARGALSYFPRRCGDTVIFNCYDPKCPPGALPREVRWVVTGLKPGQFVRIKPRDGARRAMSAFRDGLEVHRIKPKDKAGRAMFAFRDGLEVHPPFNSVTSGFPLQRAGAGRCLVWTYEIALCKTSVGRQKPQARLDPEVIIKDHP